MSIALIFQLVQLASQFFQTTHILSPSPTSTNLSALANIIVNAHDPDAVKWVQKALNAAGVAHLAVDGVMGPATEAALTALISRAAVTPDQSNILLSAIKILLSKIH
jgi:lysozyme family protein